MNFQKLAQKRSYWTAVLGAGVVAVGAISALASEQSDHWGYGTHDAGTGVVAVSALSATALEQPHQWGYGTSTSAGAGQ